MFNWDQLGLLGGIDPNQQFANTMQQGIDRPIAGLLGEVLGPDHEMVNYQETYGPKNVYSSDLGTQAQLLLSKAGLMDAPNPLTLAEQQLQTQKNAEMAAQAKAAKAAGKSFKEAMEAAAPDEEEEKLKMLTPNLRTQSAPSTINPLMGLSAYTSPASAVGINRYLPRRA